MKLRKTDRNEMSLKCKMSLTEWSSQKQSSTYNPDKYSQKQLSKHDNGFMNEPFIHHR